jgi:DNA-binding transcriptional regulator of glucitol operon
MDSGTIAVLVALVGAWMVQIVLSSNQMRRYHRRSQKLRRLGTYMSTGVAGTMYRRKVYGLLVVDADHKVVAAEQLSGWTVIARLKPVPQLVGLDIGVVGKGDPPAGVTKKQWAAFDHSAGFVRDRIHQQASKRAAERPPTVTRRRRQRALAGATAS